MSLSSYDIMAFGSKGEPCNGILSDGTCSIEIYKNWLYVHYNNFLNSGPFTGNVISEIHVCNMQISQFHVIAERGKKQDAIFVLAYDLFSKEKNVMAGIGCYGWDNPAERLIKKLNIDPKKYAEINMSSLHESHGACYHILECMPINGGRVIEYRLPYSKEFNAQYISITPETVAEFKDWLTKIINNTYAPKTLNQWLKTIKFDHAINQGLYQKK